MSRVGKILGFDVYVDPSLRPGEIALVGVGHGLEVGEVGGELVLRRRIVVTKIVNLEGDGVNHTTNTPPPDEQLDLLRRT